jgi:hypothetical protein
MRVGDREFHVHRHVVERYHERVRPTLDGELLERDLRRMLAGAEIMQVAPLWVTATANAVEWIMLGDSIAFPVGDDNRVITCLTVAEPGDENRERMRERGRDRRARNAQPGKRKKHGVVARSERRRARAQREKLDG